MGGTLVITDILGSAMQNYPAVKMHTITSKADRTQIKFGRALALTVKNVEGATMTPEQWYKAANLILQVYNKNSNAGAFLVTSSDHCHTDKPRFFTTTPAGPNASYGKPTML